jgi:site-specific DNA-methyltransferase (adenine-specific)
MSEGTIEDVLAGRATWALAHGDNEEILPVIGAVDHAIFDGPYSSAVHGKQWVSAALTENGDKRASSKHRAIDFDAITPERIVDVAAHCAMTVKRWTLSFCDVESAHLWRAAFEAGGLDYVRTCFWDKVDSSPQFTGDRPASAVEAICAAHPKGRKKWNGKRNLFRFAVNEERGDKPHPTTKPTPLMLELVKLFTDPGELVLDPFMGSATTGVACLRLGRRFIGIEKDPRYFAIARERMLAEERGLSLREARAGQTTIFDALGVGK